MYTKTGDNGTTALYADALRYPKDSPIFDALGALDELNSLIGFVKATVRAEKHRDVFAGLARVQESLFIIQAELAGAPKALPEGAVAGLERVIHGVENRIGNPGSFLISGATELSALLDFARAVARRAERAVISALPHRPVSAESRAYLNRLSSFLYALARDAAAAERSAESAPHY